MLSDVGHGLLREEAAGDELNARHVMVASSREFREATRNEAAARLRSPWHELHILEGVTVEPAAQQAEAVPDDDGIQQ
jgi:hypothetical protein